MSNKTKRMELITGHSLADGVAYWYMNQDVGNVALDLSDNNNSLGFYNNPTRVTDGQYGRAILFDDVQNQYLKRDTAILTGFPCSLVANFNMDDDNIAYHILGCAMNSVDDKYIRLITMPTHKIRLQVKNGGGDMTNLESSSTYVLNTWNQAAAVCISNTNKKLYLNSGYEGTHTTSVQFPAGLNNTTIGRLMRLNPSNSLSGKIGYAIMFNRELSQQEITWIYQNPLRMLRHILKKQAKFSKHIAA